MYVKIFTLLPILPLIWRSRSCNDHCRKNQPQLGPVHTCGGLAGGDPAGAGAGGGDVPSASSQVGYTNTALVRVKAGLHARVQRSAAQMTKAFFDVWPGIIREASFKWSKSLQCICI